MLNVRESNIQTRRKGIAINKIDKILGMFETFIRSVYYTDRVKNFFTKSSPVLPRPQVHIIHAKEDGKSTIKSSLIFHAL